MPIFTTTFDEARDILRDEARNFIGAPVKMISSAEMGGGEEDDALCNKLAALASSNTERGAGNVYFDDPDEGDGYLNYLCFEVNGVKFVQEFGDNGIVIGDEEEGKTFYVAA